MKRRRRTRRWLVLVCVMAMVPSVAQSGEGQLLARTQAEPPAMQTTPEKPTAAPSALPAGTASPQRGTDKYTLSHERYEKAVAYSRAEYTLYFVSVLLSLLVLILILRLGVAAKLRDFAEGFTESRIVQGLIFIPLLVLMLDLLELPVHLYGHSLSLHYEQSVQGWGSWFWDWTKAEALDTAFVTVLVLVLFAVIRWKPRTWWLYFWVAALPILLFIFFVSPWFIAPLFHKFEPLDAGHPELVTAIEKVVHRAGLDVPRERMFLMQASEKTNEINAYVTGVGASKRVVVWDTTIQKLTPDETLFIFGHEAGHYVLNHVRDGFLFFATSLLAALYVSFRGLHFALGRWGGGWKVYGAGDWASLAVILLIFELLMFFSAPIANGFSRMQEHNADIYGLEVIHGLVPNSAKVAAHAFQVLGDVDLADPNPSAFITLWLYSHPPLADRLVFAHSYDPWAKGESLRYINQPAK